MSNKEHIETFKRWSEVSMESCGYVPEAYGAALRALEAEDKAPTGVELHDLWKDGAATATERLEARYRALVEAAKAVVVADRNGELDDSIVNTLETALDALEG